jgi:hypothetical protein
LKFFLNADNSAYLRNLEEEFNESTNGIRLELNKMEEAGFLLSSAEKNKKIYRVNKLHPLFHDISSIIKKYVGVDQIVESIIVKLGDLKKVYLLGDLSKGLMSDKIEVAFIGNIDENYLKQLIKKVEPEIKKTILYRLVEEDSSAFFNECNKNGYLLLWSK